MTRPKKLHIGPLSHWLAVNDVILAGERALPALRWRVDI
jgi:hypothetical protein